MTTNKPTNNSFFKRMLAEHPIISNIVLILAAGFVAVTVLLLFVRVWTHHGQTSKVPDVKGMSFEQAQYNLDDSDLEIVVSDSIYDDHMAGGTVVEIWPKPGAVVKAGREVYLTIVSYSPRMVVIDIPLTDISQKQAENYLSSHGINAIKVEYVPGEFANSVVSAKVNGEYVTLGSRIPANATVVLEVSKGMDEELDAAIDAAADSVLNAIDIPEETPAEEPIDE